MSLLYAVKKENRTSFLQSPAPFNILYLIDNKNVYFRSKHAVLLYTIIFAMQSQQRSSERSAQGRPAQTRQRQTADTNMIVERISQAIVERKLPPGAKLAEEALGEVFGVSRTKVRQALFQLAKDKLVMLQPARGAFVAQPSVREAREIFEVRSVLERAVISNFTRIATPEKLAKLRSHVARERKAVTSDDVPASAKLSGEFHLLIADMAGNMVLSEMLRELVSRTSLIIVLYESSLPASCSWEDHGALLAKIDSGNSESAAQAMAEHLESIEHSLNLRVANLPAIDLRSALSERK